MQKPSHQIRFFLAPQKAPSDPITQRARLSVGASKHLCDVKDMQHTPCRRDVHTVCQHYTLCTACNVLMNPSVFHPLQTVSLNLFENKIVIDTRMIVFPGFYLLCQVKRECIFFFFVIQSELRIVALKRVILFAAVSRSSIFANEIRTKRDN